MVSSRKFVWVMLLTGLRFPEFSNPLRTTFKLVAAHTYELTIILAEDAEIRYANLSACLLIGPTLTCIVRGH